MFLCLFSTIKMLKYYEFQNQELMSNYMFLCISTKCVGISVPTLGTIYL